MLRLHQTFTLMIRTSENITVKKIIAYQGSVHKSFVPPSLLSGVRLLLSSLPQNTTMFVSFFLSYPHLAHTQDYIQGGQIK